VFRILRDIQSPEVALCAKESKHAGKQPAGSVIAEFSAIGSEQSEGGLVPNERIIDANTRIKFLDHVPMKFVDLGTREFKLNNSAPLVDR
jgi:hypothetical protein